MMNSCQHFRSVMRNSRRLALQRSYYTTLSSTPSSSRAQAVRSACSSIHLHPTRPVFPILSSIRSVSETSLSLSSTKRSRPQSTPIIDNNIDFSSSLYCLLPNLQSSSTPTPSVNKWRNKSYYIRHLQQQRQQQQQQRQKHNQRDDPSGLERSPSPFVSGTNYRKFVAPVRLKLLEHLQRQRSLSSSSTPKEEEEGEPSINNKDKVSPAPPPPQKAMDRSDEDILAFVNATLNPATASSKAKSIKEEVTKKAAVVTAASTTATKQQQQHLTTDMMMMDDIPQHHPMPTTTAAKTSDESTQPPPPPPLHPPLVSPAMVTMQMNDTTNQDNYNDDDTARHIALDFDVDAYKQIRQNQHVQRERMRAQMATNIHRALWGNLFICAAKFGAYLHSGSSGLLAEFFHSVVDCGNQALLLVGLRDSKWVADRKHPYGYGKSVYFWALVSALGTFFLGAGVSMTHAVANLKNPALEEITWHVWGVLTLGFAVDGYVFCRTIYETMQTKEDHNTFAQHLINLRDPATLAILMEDGAACLGVLIAFAGIGASYYTGNPIYDGMAGIAISTLLGLMGIALVKVNYRFLLGQAVDKHILDDIEKILLKRRSIDGIGSIQSQWTGPETFSYKAEIDFDGTYIAAKLMSIYQQEFVQIRDSMDDELQVLLALYAEDVMRTVEREVRHVETIIRKKYPGAEYIELEPMSLDADRLALDDSNEAEHKRVESEALDRYLKMLKKEKGPITSAVEAELLLEQQHQHASTAYYEEDTTITYHPQSDDISRPSSSSAAAAAAASPTNKTATF